MKSAEKVAHNERVVTIHQGHTLTVPTTVSPSPSDATPSSSGTTTPAKQDTENNGTKVHCAALIDYVGVVTQLMSIQ